MRIHSSKVILFFSAASGCLLHSVFAQVPPPVPPAGGDVPTPVPPPGQQAPEVPEQAAAPAEDRDMPNVDVEMVAGRRWKNSRRAIMQMKSNLKQFIRDEIKKAEHDYLMQEKMGSGPELGGVSIERANVYDRLLNVGTQSPASFQLSHPRFRETGARFQQVSEHDQSAETLMKSNPEGMQTLQSVFDNNQIGAFLDSSQGASPGQYLEALASAVEGSKDTENVGEEVKNDRSAGTSEKINAKNGPVEL